jgi:hypothetical protein
LAHGVLLRVCRNISTVLAGEITFYSSIISSSEKKPLDVYLRSSFKAISAAPIRRKTRLLVRVLAFQIEKAQNLVQAQCFHKPRGVLPNIRPTVFGIMASTERSATFWIA